MFKNGSIEKSVRNESYKDPKIADAIKPNENNEKGTIQYDQFTFFSRTYMSVTLPNEARSPAPTIAHMILFRNCEVGIIQSNSGLKSVLL